MTIPKRAHRPIRSFMRREGKGALLRASILRSHGQAYCVAIPDGILDQQAIFGRINPLVLEIGFGRGETLFQMAEANPQKDFLGIEVYRTGVSQLIARAEQAHLQNLRVFIGDAPEILAIHLKDASLQAIHILFPDPWPKRKHYKRRLIQLDFVQLMALKLEPGGRLHLATDWMDYAAWMMEVLSENPHFENEAGTGCYAPRPLDRPVSKYEARGLALGHRTWDLIFRRAYNKSLSLS